MSIDHNRIKVADLEKNLPNKILTTNTNGELEFSDMYNGLDCTAEGKVLDARQGKVLKDLVDNVNALLTSDNINLNTIQELVDAIEIVQNSLNTILVNDLSTGGITKALTAEMGKLLEDTKVDKVAGERLINAAEITKLGNQSGVNTGDETAATIKTKLGISTLWGNNTGDQVIPTTLPASDVYAWAKEPIKPTYTNAEVGLGNVDNTSDVNKPVSTATQTALNTKEDKSNKNIANGYAGLGSDGKLISSQLPSITISNTFVVASQAAMLALAVETGDVAVRTDLNKSFILKGTNPTVLADWQDLLTPTDSVSTVFGRNGSVTAQAGDYTADQITETTTRKFQTANQQAFNDATSSIQTQLNSKENSFSKNTAFNKNFGTSVGTIAEGNDSRINNGQTAFGWGNHTGLYQPIENQRLSTGYSPSFIGLSLTPTSVYSGDFITFNSGYFTNRFKIDGNGTYAGVSLVDANNNAIVKFQTNQTLLVNANSDNNSGAKLQVNGGITAEGNFRTLSDNSVLLAGNNGDIGFVKTGGYTGRLAVGNDNSFRLVRSNQSVIGPSDTFTNLLTIDVINNATFTGSVYGYSFHGIGSGLTGTASGLSIGGTASNISNTGTVTLGSSVESNAITISQPSYSTDLPVKLLNFDWYGNTWSMGNIRSGGTSSNGFGFYKNGVEHGRFVDGIGVGYFKTGYLEMSAPTVDATSIGDIVTTAGGSVLRRSSAGAVKTFLGLNDIFEHKTGISIDVNSTSLGTALYRGSTSTWSNQPAHGHNGNALLNIETHPGGYFSQIWFDTGAGDVRIRKADATIWSNWRTLLHSDNINAYAIQQNNRTNWSSVGGLGNVVGQLAWKNYGNNHTIFDASAGTSPDGTTIPNGNAQQQWTGSYPTLMGWNGTYTYGVRVDSARSADTITGITPDTASIANTVAVRNGAGDLSVRELIMTSATHSENSVEALMGLYSGTNQIVKYSAAAIANFLNGSAINRWYDGWVTAPGYDANTIGGNKNGFTYSNNAPWSGQLVNFSSGGYNLQLNSNYTTGIARISFRTHQSDIGQWGTWGEFITSGNIGSQSVSYAGLLNPLNGDSNYKLGFSASGTRDNAGEWGRAVMRYEPNGQTYGIRVDRADYADSAGTATDSSKLPLTGGTMTGQLLFTNGLGAASDSTPSAISFGRVQTFGNLHLNADTDGSGSEYIFLTSGYGTGSSNAANGLAIGYNSLTWKNNNVLHAGNFSTYAMSRYGDTAGGTYSLFSTNTSGSYYTRAIELREVNLATTADLNPYMAPSIGFHWGGVNQRQIAMRSDGALVIREDSGNGNVILHGGNYSSYSPSLTGNGASGTWGINISGSAETVDGIDSSRIVYGEGARGKSIRMNSGNANTSDASNPSGFFFGNTVTGMPSNDWWNWINVAGNDWSGSDGYGFQIANSFWSDDLRVRRLTSGTWNGWNTILHSGNVGTYVLPIGGGTVTGNITANSFIKSGGTSSQYLMADGSVSLGYVGSCVDLSTNQIIGGNKTFTGTTTLTVSDISGRESILKGTVADNSVDMFQIANGTTTSARFIPTFIGYTGGAYQSLLFRGLGSYANDSYGVSPYIQFLAANTDNPTDPNNGTLTAPVYRKLFTWGTTVDYMTMTADGSLLLKTGNKVDAYQFNNSTNGYYILDSGLIIQWAYLSSGSTTYNFPLAWPTGAFSVVVSTNRTSSGSNGTNHVGNVTTTSYYAVLDGSTGRMFAIGR